MYMLISEPSSGDLSEAFDVLDNVFGTDEFTQGQAVNAISVGLEVDNAKASNLFGNLIRGNYVGEV